MAEFVPGRIVRSKVPIVRVDTALAPGTYRFQLVVVDDRQNVSSPATLSVRIIAPAHPF